MRVIMIGLRVCATTTSRSVCAIHIRQNETTRLTNTSGLVIDLMASSLVGWKESMSTAGVKSRYIAGGKTSPGDRKSTRLNSSHGYISYAVFCLKKKKKTDD